MARRRMLPALSALWLAALIIGGLLAAGMFGPLPDAAQVAIVALLLGFGAFILTGWAMAARTHWQARQAPQPSGQGIGQTLDDLTAMTPGEFEVWVQELFRSRGYFAKNTPDSGDHGVDLWVISPQGERAIVQCKRYRGVVGESVVRDLYGVMQHEAAPRGFLVTTGSISAAAGRWAQGKPIELIDGARLARLASGQADPSEPLAGKEKAIDV
ncbi:MAG TPA: restriction endonuclease [Anaerolineae bacterium]|nr:restriction endonuclease [Anaerolineae bacterium]HNU05884.1 restriction endonuclease [Anaerolineae bacterium]